MNLGRIWISRAVCRALLPIACASFLAVGHAQDAAVGVWITAADQSHLMTRTADASFRAGAGSGPFVINVDDSVVYQTMAGFGASMTESSAWLLYRQLDAGTRDAAMRQLFSPSDGIGLSFLRQPIGASDFSLSHYSYDDVPNGERDDALARFSTARDEAFLFPALREAKRLNPALSIMASPWSPPGWMKTSGSMVGGALLPDAREAFAAYLVRTVQALQAQGLPVDSVSLQNEPHYVPQDYPGMYMLAPEQALLIGQHVGPAFAQAGLGTKILVWDQNWSDTDYPTSVLRDSAAAQYADGAAFHCYAGDASAMTQLHDAFPAATIYVTECSTGAWSVTPFGTALYENMRLLVRSTRNWAQAVVKWNVALDENMGPRAGGCTTCSPLVTVNRANGTLHPTADFYAVGQFSKFVAPGARRVASTSFEPQGVESVAFVNPDGSHALVVWNGWGPRRVAVTWQGSAFEYDLPGEAVATFVWGAGTTPPPPPPPPASPAFQVPGRIEAEDFLLYADATSGNSGGEYRMSDVDIERSTDTGGGFNVGWISPGEWLSFPIDVQTQTVYRLEARVAAYGPGGTFHVEVDGVTSGRSMSHPEYRRVAELDHRCHGTAARLWLAYAAHRLRWRRRHRHRRQPERSRRDRSRGGIDDAVRRRSGNAAGAGRSRGVRHRRVRVRVSRCRRMELWRPVSCDRGGHRADDRFGRRLQRGVDRARGVALVRRDAERGGVIAVRRASGGTRPGRDVSRGDRRRRRHRAALHRRHRRLAELDHCVCRPGRRLRRQARVANRLRRSRSHGRGRQHQLARGQLAHSGLSATGAAGAPSRTHDPSHRPRSS